MTTNEVTNGVHHITKEVFLAMLEKAGYRIVKEERIVSPEIIRYDLRYENELETYSTFYCNNPDFDNLSNVLKLIILNQAERSFYLGGLSKAKRLRELLNIE